MTDMNSRTVRRTLKNYYDYGDVVPPKMGQVGRPRALNGLDMCVSCARCFLVSIYVPSISKA